MPALTVTGLPYPLPTEPVRDGAAAIQALAQKTETMVQGGVAILTTNNGGDFNITFTRPFKAGTVPMAMVQHADPATSGVFLCTVYNLLTTNLIAPAHIGLSTTGAAVANGSIRVHWLAIGVAP